MRKFTIRLVLLLAVLGLTVAASPGSAQDPLVTESYLLMQLEQEREAREMLAERVASLEKELQQLSLIASQQQVTTAPSVTPPVVSSTTSVLEPLVLSLRAGEAVYASAGTELILRSGDVVALAPGAGGLADLTRAVDVRHGEFVGQNHLLLVARDDERGVEALTDAVLLVRGEIRYRP